MPVALQFCGFTSAIANAIEWFSQGHEGHVDAVLHDGSLLGAQHEAGLGGKPAGVQIRPADYGDHCGMTDRVRVTLPATPEQEAAWDDFLMEQVGKPYDITAIEAFVVGRDWHNPQAWFCSELQAAALEAAGIIRPLASPVNKITPMGLLLACSAIAPVVPEDHQ